MKIIASITLFIAMSPAMGQSFYKCPSPTAGAPPVIQQMPCPATGGGETINVTAPKPGADGGLRESEKEFSKGLNEAWAVQAEKDRIERERQQALSVERDKARAAEEQAAAQRATAAAIWATGRRW